MTNQREIERKFLLRYGFQEWDIEGLKAQSNLINVSQWYLLNGIRIRKEQIPGVSENYTINVKSDINYKIIRQEWEEFIPYWVARKLVQESSSVKVIHKTRCSWNENNLHFDLDTFHLTGMQDFSILEIEFPSIKKALAFDYKILDFPIETEVTYNPAFYNYNIAEKATAANKGFK